MKSDMTSAQRIRAVVAREPVDHTPLCFEGIFHSVISFLKRRIPDPIERCDYYLSLGLDTAVSASPEPVDLSGVEIADATDHPVGERYPVMRRTYATDAGTLGQTVRLTEDYGVGVGEADRDRHVRLMSDHNVPPSRSIEYLVGGPEHLPALEALLKIVEGRKKDAYLAEARRTAQACRQRGVLTAGYSQGIGDPLIWMSGIENVLVWAMEQPEFLSDYVAVVARWNMDNLKLMAEAGCRYIVRRGWYESADFWSPTLFRRFLLPGLRAETDFCRANGILYAYCMNSGIDPLLDELADSGIDILCNIDPMAAATDLALIKTRLGPTVTLCGGVNNQHVIYTGDENRVRAAVDEAFEHLAPGGGFMLAPGDSLLDCSARTEANFHAMIDAWRQRIR